MTGLLFLFTAPSVAGTRDSEKFVNPNKTSVKIDIEEFQTCYTQGE